jgi:hypothetical protein
VQHVGAAAALERVVAAVAGETVGAAGALHHVVAVAPEQPVDAVVADERIGVLRAGEILDRRQHVALGRAAEADSGGEVDGHADGGILVDRLVAEAPAAVKIIGAKFRGPVHRALRPEAATLPQA